MNTDRFPAFVAAMTALVARTGDEPTLLREGRALLTALVRHDDWLPDRAAVARDDRYAQHLLHRDPQGRFSVVSFVWGPGHRTPVHDHTVWGLVGVMRGAERCEECSVADGAPRLSGHAHVMQPGDVEAVSPTVGDWHRVSSARDDGLSISIHVYGADIGQLRRHRLDDRGAVIDFVSGYDSLPAC
ncbi:cysteine dioxygenase family protein [Rubrivivax albus]|uniref:Cysteine dioxygenase n=1 Tax=Rubrivivax albus TaxID=2499835 RepID=A0A437JX68_9BURK|nr:cysteine dioxygenase [Rubrivivax albus]RVT52273.1 cysteine dioxygenase [Rubrivivax albus]